MPDPSPPSRPDRAERRARAILAAMAVALLAGMSLVDLPRLAGGRFWSDGATYHAMAWSLAADADLRYEAADLERVRAEYPSGPEGVFLKRARGGHLYYAKAFLHPLLAAPFVAVAGTRGLLVANALALALVLALGYDLLRRRLPAGAGLAAALTLCLPSVVPVYLFWPQPELVNLALVTAALWAWARGRPVASAVLFGLAVYSKPTHLLLALPLGVAPLLDAARPPAARLRESVLRGVWLVATAALLFGTNALVTGEWNYQGGERKTFHGRFPFDAAGATFENTGFWMTTEQVGPRTADAGSTGQAERGVIVRDRAELRETFLRNLAYFWVGRYAGVVPYFFPFAAFLAGFLLAGLRSREGWLAVAALCLSWLAFIGLIPDNWYGGGGTVGNRYFLSLVPLAFFLVPARRPWAWIAAGALGGAVLAAPILGAPVRRSLEPWRNAQRPLLSVFPLELTMLNDLGFCSDPWRKKQPFGDVDGDPRAGHEADPRSYWLYFADDGTYGRERVEGAEGFWLRRGRRAEIVLRAHHPVRRVVARVHGGPAGDIVSLEGAGRGVRPLPLAPFQQGELSLEPGRGYRFYDTWVYRLRLASSGRPETTAPSGADPRALGAFVRFEIEVERDTQQ
jgi:hypothetical protein